MYLILFDKLNEENKSLASPASSGGRVMVPCNPKSFALALLLGVLPMGFACAGGSGRGGGAVIGGGVGAAGAGSAAVGGGAPFGRVGGGPPAGALGGGLPGRMDPGGNGAAGTGNPGLNALGAGSGIGTNEPGIPSSKTLGGAPGGLGYSTGVTPAAAPLGGAAPLSDTGYSPNASGNKQAPPPNLASPSVYVPGDAPFSATGFSRPGPDGVSTVYVEARPCSLAAHETDGFTTCVGIPNEQR
jgi:hypothetical protein